MKYTVNDQALAHIVAMAVNHGWELRQVLLPDSEQKRIDPGMLQDSVVHLIATVKEAVDKQAAERPTLYTPRGDAAVTEH